MQYNVFYVSQKHFENSFRKLTLHISLCNNNLVVKHYGSDFMSLNAPKFTFLEEKLRIFEVLKLKKGAFKDYKVYRNFEHAKSVLMSYTTCVVNFGIMRQFRASNAPFF